MAKKILFYGDSITDCRRQDQELYKLGNGYANMVAAHLGVEYPEQYEFVNRGVSGNRVVDLYARIKEAFINEAPDYASIYIGVNDVWHDITKNKGVATEKFERIYCMMIDEIKEALPDIKLFILAPYVLEGYGTCNTEEIPDKLEQFKKGVAEKNAAAKRVAEKYGIPCIDLQAAFDEASQKAPNQKWAEDGVHPMPCGHELIKRLWLKTFEKIK